MRNRRHPGREWARGVATGLALVVAMGIAWAAPSPKGGGLGPVSGGSFPRRHEEYVALVENGSERAFAQLVAAYRRRDLEATERARIVSLACDGFAAADWVGSLRAWREKDASEDDAWLWYRTLRREIGSEGPRNAYAAARDGTRPVALRAAAIRALAAWADPGLLELVTETAKGDLGAEPARSVLLEALGEALASEGGRVGSPELRTAFEALLPWLEPGACEPRTRLVLGRAFARLLDVPRVSLDASLYEALLDRREAPPSPDADRYAAPRYFGIEATGDRVVYVVDESGSMNMSLTEEELKDLREAATGVGPAKPPTPLPWDKIKTRRDAALEFTKASLRALPETASFGVVLFASGMSWILEPFQLVPATKANVDKAVRALDGPRVGGGTNLHGALRRAVDAGVGARKAKFPLGAALDPNRLAAGPTTIFLMTDGEPSADDWGFDFRGIAATAGPSPTDWMPTAPYQEPVSLADDVERLILFRGCEVHAVGIGEADARLLDLLSHAGRGQVRRIGPATKLWFSGTGLLEGAEPGHAMRDAVEKLKALGVPIPKAVQDAADEEERQEKARGASGGAKPPPSPPPSPPTAPDAATPPTPRRAYLEADRLRVAQGLPTDEAVATVKRLGNAKYALAVPTLAQVLSVAEAADLAHACESALRAIAGRRFLPWIAGLPAHEREALRRNWLWWYEVHRAAIEKAEADLVEAAGKPAAPEGGAGSGPK